MNRIKDLRSDADMKQSELAEKLNIARTVVSKYELGQVDLSTDTIRRLCEIFGCSADYLLGLSSQRSPMIPEEDADLVAAYHAAPPSVRAGIDALLEPYREKENTAAG